MGDLVLQSYGCTDIGHQRSFNEDYIDIKNSLFVLADGMGGHNAGDIASKLAVEKIVDFFDSINKKEIMITDDVQIEQFILDVISKTNETVYKESLHNRRLEGMGTTLVLAFFQKPETMHIANVGDSRAYLLRKGSLQLLTEDHSVTASLLRDGTITKIEAETHPYRHHLTRSIGTSNEIQPFTTFFNVSSGDKLL
ncbi:MAG TPA: protein phosphatase 2C domain-containing protein, partial [Candidatus Thermoplasmatota archaeon]|nr:protein phosphatase 2C domain-containing protein [Candidatus Thermoplasmatota archaeon]